MKAEVHSRILQGLVGHFFVKNETDAVELLFPLDKLPCSFVGLVSLVQAAFLIMLLLLRFRLCFSMSCLSLHCGVKTVVFAISECSLGLNRPEFESWLYNFLDVCSCKLFNMSLRIFICKMGPMKMRPLS